MRRLKTFSKKLLIYIKIYMVLTAMNMPWRFMTSFLFCVKAGKAVQAADSIQSLMSVVEKNIYSRFRNEKYDLRLKKLYEKIQKM